MKLGTLLLRNAVIGLTQLEAALRNQVLYGGKLGTNLVELGFVELDLLAEYLSELSGLPIATASMLDAAPREALAQVATRAGGFRVHAPLIEMSKAEIIRAGLALGVDYALTHSCYDPVGDRACGRCDSCLLRKKGFADAGVADPTRYA